MIFTANLPKTRSGKIMRRLLWDIAEGKALGDTTTLADPNMIARLKEQYQKSTESIDPKHRANKNFESILALAVLQGRPPMTPVPNAFL